jgi:hypothetical protein
MRQATFALVILFAVPAAFAGKTTIKDEAELKLLLGTHPFALQWISWQKFGRVEIIDKQGEITITGKQEDKKAENYMKIDGIITEVSKRSFKFMGTIVYRVTHLNSGKPCTREGSMTFKRRGKRKYWRLTRMTNPCDGCTDYIDVFTTKLDKKKD